MSTSQIERLGISRMRSTPPNPADLAQLHTLLGAYSGALEDATNRVRGAVGYAPSARVKNTGTILEKLERYGGSWLKSIHDLAGMRVVRNHTRSEQDLLVKQIMGIFANDSRTPKVIDRRLTPIQGYRAVHIVVYPDGFPIEVQVRTRMQHEWAELYEKLADQLGRGIRYGEPPQHWLLENPPEALSREQRDSWQQGARALHELISSIIGFADVIDGIERQEQQSEKMSEVRPRVASVLGGINTILNNLSDLDTTGTQADNLD